MIRDTESRLERRESADLPRLTHYSERESPVALVGLVVHGTQAASGVLSLVFQHISQRPDNSVFVWPEGITDSRQSVLFHDKQLLPQVFHLRGSRDWTVRVWDSRAGMPPLTATSSRVVHSGFGSNTGGRLCHVSDSRPKRSFRSFVKRRFCCRRAGR